MARSSPRWPSFVQTCVAFAIICSAAAVIFPVFRSPNFEGMKRRSCLSNLKQLGLAAVQYAQDSDDCFPSGKNTAGGGWAGQLYPFVKSMGPYRCPSDPQEGKFVSYAENRSIIGRSRGKFPAPARTVTLYEFTTPNCDPSTAESVSATGLSAPSDSVRHDSSQCPFGLNFLFADGHAKFLMPEQVSGGRGVVPATVLPQGKVIGTFAVK